MQTICCFIQSPLQLYQCKGKEKSSLSVKNTLITFKKKETHQKWSFLYHLTIELFIIIGACPFFASPIDTRTYRQEQGEKRSGYPLVVVSHKPVQHKPSSVFLRQPC